MKEEGGVAYIEKGVPIENFFHQNRFFLLHFFTSSFSSY